MKIDKWEREFVRKELCTFVSHLRARGKELKKEIERMNRLHGKFGPYGDDLVLDPLEAVAVREIVAAQVRLLKEGLIPRYEKQGKDEYKERAKVTLGRLESFLENLKNETTKGEKADE